MASGFLEPYRVLDLTDEKGSLCGRLLGDFGADVIKIEPPGGDSTRLRSPFWGDVRHAENSLVWQAFNANKRGIILDLEQDEGREIFKQLLRTADFVLESFTPGYLDRIGLGYEVLSRLRPEIILTSITPFGQTGPYKHFKATDITLMALGGICKLTGDRDRAPLRSCLDHSYALGSLNAAAASLMAAWHRHAAGSGQWIDVSIFESVVRLNFREPVMWEVGRKMTLRSANRVTRTSGDFQFIWKCKDGHLTWLMFGGRGSRENKQLSEWMTEKGVTEKGVVEELQGAENLNLAALGLDELRHWEQVIQDFFLTVTKKECREASLGWGVRLAPISSIDEVVSDEHLKQRGFWSQVPYPERGRSVTVPGRLLLSNACDSLVHSRAPLLGEHSLEVLKEIQALPPQERSPVGTSRATGSQHETLNGPLEGIKVLDFTWWVAGPYATKMLADHGAEVIKIESMKHLDLYRQSEPFARRASVDTSVHFVHMNTSKRSVTLDLSLPAGIELARRLGGWADVVVDNFRPGTMNKLGLGYEELTKIRPDIVMISLSCLGQTGPLSGPGHAHISGALSGHYHMTGWPDRSPVYASAGLADVIQPLVAVAAIMGALDYRKRTGKGQYIDLSQLEPMVHLAAPAVMDFVVNGRVMGRYGNRHPDAAPHALFPCKGEDQWCAISVFSEGDWQALCRIMGRLELVDDPRFKALVQRKQNEDELEEIIASWTAKYSARDLMGKLQQAGVAAGVAQDVQDLLENDPQLKARGSFLKLEHPEIGVCSHPAPPFKLSETPARIRTSPCMGQDNLYVFKEVLGLSEDEISDLIAHEALAELD